MFKFYLDILEPIIVDSSSWSGSALFNLSSTSILTLVEEPKQNV